MGQPGRPIPLIPPELRRRLGVGLSLALRGELLSLMRRTRAGRGVSISGPKPYRSSSELASDRAGRQEPITGSVVSVIIPCFNHGSFVAEAVASALSQTYRNLEVIVVEGGSTDGTTPRQVRNLEGLGDPRLRILYRDRPSLLGDNRNFGVRHARGRYLCCLDADDRLEPTYLDVATFLLERRAYDVVSSAIRCFGDEDRCVGTLTYPALTDLLRLNWVSGAAVFRRDLYERAGGYRDTGLGPDYVFEDWRLWVRMAALGARIANIPQPLMLYRTHSGPRLSQSPSLPGYNAQRRAVAQLNRDLLTRVSRRRSRRLRAFEIRLSDGDQTGSANNGVRVGGILAIADEQGDLTSVLLPAPIPAHASRTSLVVLVSTSRQDPARTSIATGRGHLQHFHLPGLLRQQDWSDFCSHLIRTKGLTALAGTVRTGKSPFVNELRRLHPTLPFLSSETLSPVG